jgi:hypothetical protein
MIRRRRQSREAAARVRAQRPFGRHSPRPRRPRIRGNLLCPPSRRLRSPRSVHGAARCAATAAYPHRFSARCCGAHSSDWLRFVEKRSSARRSPGLAPPLRTRPRPGMGEKLAADRGAATAPWRLPLKKPGTAEIFRLAKSPAMSGTVQNLTLRGHVDFLDRLGGDLSPFPLGVSFTQPMTRDTLISLGRYSFFQTSKGPSRAPQRRALFLLARRPLGMGRLPAVPSRPQLSRRSRQAAGIDLNFTPIRSSRRHRAVQRLL